MEGVSDVTSLDVVDVCAFIRARCAAAGSQREWAQMHGFTEQFVSAVLSARKMPSDRMLEILGLRKVVRFQPIGFKP